MRDRHSVTITPSDRVVHVVDGDLAPQLLDALLDDALDSGVGIDTETSGLSPLTARLEVVSLATRRHIVVVCLEQGQLAPLVCQLLLRPDILKIFHHALFDAGFLRYHWKLGIQNVFCTKVAARLVGTDRNPRLEFLAETLLGRQINKGEQLSKWSARPLSDRQVHYAVADVAYLHELSSVLKRRLAEQGQWQLFETCMQFLPARVDLALMGLDDVFAYDIGTRGVWQPREGPDSI